MKKRYLSRMISLTIITLGLYELYWLAQTRNEMVSKFGAKIPSTGYVILVRVLQLIGFLSVVAIVFYFIPKSDQAIHNSVINRVKPPAECISEYNQNVQCRQAIDKYYAPTSNAPFILFGVVMGLIVASGVLYWLYMRRWVVAYGLAVQKVTGDELPATVAVLALGGVIPLLGMIYVQQAFNQVR